MPTSNDDTKVSQQPELEENSAGSTEGIELQEVGEAVVDYDPDMATFGDPIPDAPADGRELEAVEDQRSLAKPRSAIDRAFDFVEAAVARGASPDDLDKLISLSERVQDRAAKREFFEHFAQMQGELVPVERSKEAYDSDKNKHLYDYAGIDDIIIANGPIIARHGFSWRFEQETVFDAEGKPNGDVRYYCIVSGFGHQESTYVDLPREISTPITNSAQKRGTSGSYGDRYAFKKAFGVVVLGEDDDALSFTEAEVEQYGEWTAILKNSPSIDDLRVNFAAAWEAYNGDQKGQELMQRTKDRRKADLQIAARRAEAENA